MKIDCKQTFPDLNGKPLRDESVEGDLTLGSFVAGLLIKPRQKGKALEEEVVGLMEITKEVQEEMVVLEVVVLGRTILVGMEEG